MQIPDMEGGVALPSLEAGQEGVEINKKQSLKRSNLRSAVSVIIQETPWSLIIPNAGQ